MAAPGVYRPLICPQCRSDVAFSTPEADEVLHCTTCGCTWIDHLHFNTPVRTTV